MLKGMNQGGTDETQLRNFTEIIIGKAKSIYFTVGFIFRTVRVLIRIFIHAEIYTSYPTFGVMEMGLTRSRLLQRHDDSMLLYCVYKSRLIKFILILRKP